MLNEFLINNSLLTNWALHTQLTQHLLDITE